MDGHEIRALVGAIREHVPMESLLAHLGSDIPDWRTTNSDGWRTTTCPVCGSETGGRFVDGEHPETGRPSAHLRCFACDFRGDQIKLVQRVTGKRRTGAIMWLAETFDVPAPSGPSRTAQRTPLEQRILDFRADPVVSPLRAREIRTEAARIAQRVVYPGDGRAGYGAYFTGRESELGPIIDDAITAAVKGWDPDRGGFSTLLNRVLRNMLWDWIEDNERWLALGAPRGRRKGSSPRIVRADHPTLQKIKALGPPNPSAEDDYLRTTNDDYLRTIGWLGVLAEIETTFDQLHRRYASVRWGWPPHEYTVAETMRVLGITRMKARVVEAHIVGHFRAEIETYRRHRRAVVAQASGRATA
jgi:hypothetical protein